MERMLIQPHSADFSHLAQLWGATYLRIESADDTEQLDELPESGTFLVELVPDAQQTEQFYARLAR
jgi:2-succinyl-5-enolpyruvyl-6-hydroxy-3-cyclohexene-1-carboxylate synthase